MKNKFRKILLCCALGCGSILGVPMKAEEIEELMASMNQPKVAQTLPEEAYLPEWLKRLLRYPR